MKLLSRRSRASPSPAASTSSNDRLLRRQEPRSFFGLDPCLRRRTVAASISLIAWSTSLPSVVASWRSAIAARRPSSPLRRRRRGADRPRRALRPRSCLRPCACGVRSVPRRRSWPWRRSLRPHASRARSARRGPCRPTWPSSHIRPSALRLPCAAIPPRRAGRGSARSCRPAPWRSRAGTFFQIRSANHDQHRERDDHRRG